jgi:hypothetical protein
MISVTTRVSGTLVILGMLLLSPGLPSREAAADNLTGTWVGTQSCDTISSTGVTDKTGAVKGLTLKISQAVDDTSAYMYFVEANRLYNGVVIDETKFVKGVAAQLPKTIATFVSCPTQSATPGFADLPPGSEMVSANFRFGTFDKLAQGVSYVFAEDGSHQSCKWNNFKRTDETDPNIAPCP